MNLCMHLIFAECPFKVPVASSSERDLETDYKVFYSCSEFQD